MKTKTMTKALLLSLCAVLLVIGSVFTTLALLTSNDSVTNTFTVGSVAITLDEAKVDVYGKDITPASRVKANEYKLIPGHSYKKDPTVHFAANSEESWLFIKVQNEISAIEDGTKIAAQITANGWSALTGVDNVYYKKVDANTTSAAVDYPVFSSFKVSETADLSSYAGKTIVVKAYAIQADGITTASAAWTKGGFASV